MGNKLLHSPKGGRRSSGLLPDGPRMASISLSHLKARAKGLACCPTSGELYVVYGNAIIVIDTFRNVSRQYGDIKQAGYANGAHDKALFNHPHGMCFFNHKLLICDRQNHRIRTVDHDNVETFAGNGDEGHKDGPLLDATFSHPADLASYKASLYVSSWGHIRVISSNGMVSTLRTNDGSIQAHHRGLFRAAFGICARSDGALFVSHTTWNASSSDPEYYPYQVSMIDLNTMEVKHVSKSEKASDSVHAWERPTGLCVTNSGELIVCEHSQNALLLIDTGSMKSRPLLRGMSKAHDFVYQMSKQMAAKSAFDGLLHRAWTIDPMFIVLTDQGDLVWTEASSNKVRYIANFQNPCPADHRTGDSGWCPTLDDATSPPPAAGHSTATADRQSTAAGSTQTSDRLRTVAAAAATTNTSDFTGLAFPGALATSKPGLHPSNAAIASINSRSSSSTPCYYCGCSCSLPAPSASAEHPSTATGPQIAYHQRGSSCPHCSEAASFADPSFVDLFGLPRFEDFTITHKPSGTAFKLCKSIITVVAPQLLSQSAKKKLARTDIPPEIIRQFFSLLYGSSNPLVSLGIVTEISSSTGGNGSDGGSDTLEASSSPRPYDTCLEIAQLLHLAFITGLERDHHRTDWIHLLEARLYALLFSNPANLTQKLMDKIVSEMDGQESLLQILFLALEKHGLQTDLPAAKAGVSPKSQRRFMPPRRSGSKESALTTRMPKSALQTRLSSISSKLAIFISDTIQVDQSALPGVPNFKLTIQGHGQSIYVHDWVLQQRWPYFRDAMNSGLEESQAACLELPDHFSPHVLRILVRYLYTCGEDFGSLTKEDCFWILQHGAQFGLVSLDGSTATAAFPRLMQAIQWTLLAPLTVDNCLDSLRARFLMKRTKESDLTAQFVLSSYPHFRDSKYLQSQLEKFINVHDDTVPQVAVLLGMLNSLLAGDTTPRRTSA